MKYAWLLLLVSVSFAQERRLVDPGPRLTLGDERLLSASVSLGDIDGDGDLDAVVANGRHWPQQNFVYRLTRGGFNVEEPLGRVRSTTYAVPLVDIDGDGDLDALTGNDMAPNRIFLNDGSGTFVEAGTFGEPEAPTRNLIVFAAGVLVLNRGRPNELCRSSGDAGLECSALGDGAEATLDAAAADFDGDGDLDLALANRERQANVVLWNDDGRFDRRLVLPGEPRDSRGVVAGDLDGDGTIDLAFANLDGANRIHRGNGKGGFSDPEPFGPDDEVTVDLAAADFDLDGDLDLIVANRDRPSAVYFNVGRRFEGVAVSDEKSSAYAVAVGNIDRDDFPDAVIANSGQRNLVLINRPR